MVYYMEGISSFNSSLKFSPPMLTVDMIGVMLRRTINKAIDAFIEYTLL